MDGNCGKEQGAHEERIGIFERGPGQSSQKKREEKKRERLWIPESVRDATETGSAGPMTRTETGSS